MILLWGLKKIPLLLEIPALKDHLKYTTPRQSWDPQAKLFVGGLPPHVDNEMLKNYLEKFLKMTF